MLEASPNTVTAPVNGTLASSGEGSTANHEYNANIMNSAVRAVSVEKVEKWEDQ